MPKGKVIVVGAGLSGSLMALMLARRGYDVEVYERRPDLRKEDIPAGRSINLAFSDRGIEALRRVGLAGRVLANAIPMHGRLIHDAEGSTYLLPYSGRQGKYINSVMRGDLNALLMTEAEQAGAWIHFKQRCIDADLQTGTITLRDETSKVVYERSADVIIGADGAPSAIRTAFLKRSAVYRFSFSQQYLTHGYKELYIPPAPDGAFRIEKNALHIWPRHQFMMIALPNHDGSFTVTVFLPFEGENSFEQLNAPARVRAFFETQFPDAAPLLDRLEERFLTNPTGSLATIKCYPWQINRRFLLIGDAAHAIVPFYGQGMICSFEDCRIIDQLLDLFDDDWGRLMETYPSARKPDTDAIADLAEANFYEMRDHVADPVFVRKRRLELRLEAEIPEYNSKYSLVTFRPDLPYAVAKELGDRLDAFLLDYCRSLSDDQVDALDVKAVWDEIRRTVGTAPLHSNYLANPLERPTLAPTDAGTAHP